MKHFSKTLILLLVLGIFLTLGTYPARAEDGDTEKLTMTWSLNNGTLYISANGIMNNYPITQYSGEIPWYSRRSEITRIVINEGVTTVGQSAFINCTKVTSVSLPSTLKGIEAQAFMGCTALTEIVVPNNVTYILTEAFAGCTALKKVVLGDQMTKLRNYDGTNFASNSPFKNCSALTELSVPAGCAGLLSSQRFYGSGWGNPTALSKLIFRGTKEEWFTATSVLNCWYQGSLILADEIVCTDGPLNKTTDPVWQDGSFTLYGDRSMVINKEEFYMNVANVQYIRKFVEKVTFPYTLTSISENQFSKWTAIKTVVFEGTEAEWNAVNIASGNDIIVNAAKIFHTHGSSKVIVIPPTCSTLGYSFKQCSTCGRQIGDAYNFQPMTDHLYTIDTVLVEATCVNTGTVERHCVDCAQTWTVGTPIDSTKHVNTSPYTLNATCVNRGETGIKCTDCGAVISRTYTTDTVDHSWMYEGNYEDCSGRLVCKNCHLTELSTTAPGEEFRVYVSPEVRYMTIANDTLLGIEVEYSTNAGKTWTVLGTLLAGEHVEKSYSLGTTYQFRSRYMCIYNGVKEYSAYSDTRTIALPKGLTINSIVNISGGQRLTWTGISETAGTDISYYLIEDWCTGQEPYIYKYDIKPTTLNYKVHNINGKKHSYIICCQYTEPDGSQITLTSTKKYYYYLTCPSLTYYKNISAGKIKLTWKRNSAASGYQVKYVTGTTTKTYTITSNRTVTKTLTKLKKGKTYKCYVRSYKTVSGKKYYSAWSSYKSVKVTR